MEFRIAKQEFLRGLRLAQGIADRKSTMPMLANVLLRTQGKNQLLVAATDLNVSLTAELKSNNASEGGITLGAKNLYELIANAPGDDVLLKKADNHWAEIKSGKVTYRIVGMPDRDFPKVPDHREAQYATLESAVLREMGARIVGHQSSVSPAARRCGRVRRTGTSRTSIGPARSARTRDGR